MLTRSRIRTRTKSLSTFPILLGLLALLISSTQSISPDYADGDGDIATNNGSANSEALAANNDEIYDPALLQQEVEASEQRNSLETMEAATQTDQPLNSSMESHANRMSLSGEYDEDGGEDISMNMPATTTRTIKSDNNATITLAPPTKGAPAAATPTTLVSDYVRQGKSEKFPNVIVDNTPTMMPRQSTAHNDDVDEEMSNSDYVEDEIEPSLQGGTIKELTKSSEEIVPLAMRFYHNEEANIEEKDPIAVEVDDNKLKEHQQQTHDNNNNNNDISLKEQQQLPKEQQRQSFHPNSSEEEYYEDSSIVSSGEREQQQQMLPNVPSTYPPAIIAIAQAGAFPLSFNGGSLMTFKKTTTTIPTTSSQTTTTTITPAPAVVTTTDDAATSTTAAAIATFTTNGPLLSRPSSVPLAITTTTPKTITTSSPPSAATATTSLLGVAMDTILTGTTTLRPSDKKGKQLNTSRPKLLPHEQLRNYIEDAYIRMPLAVIVDPSAESLEKTKTLWRDALTTDLNIKIVLVSLNGSGIPAAYNFNNTRQFLAGLNSIKEHDGGNAFIGILHAAELVPYDSAVFISTAKIPPHTELVQDAAITLLKKRIRLYLMWYGERSISENETQEAVGGILGEVSIRSGGEILHIVGSENSQELEGSTLTIIADAYHGTQELDIPVDTTLSSLHVKIDTPMRTAMLDTPNGEINLKKLVKFKSHLSLLGHDERHLDAYVPLTKLRKATIFHLKLIPENPDNDYRVIVRADRKADLFLEDMIKRFDTYFMEGISAYPTRFRDSRLQSLTAALAAISRPTHDNLKFPEDERIESNEISSKTSPKSEVETFSETEIKTSSLGSASSNASGNVTNTKLMKSNIGTQRAVNVLQQGVTKIEMGLHSQILVAPGMMAQLYFEVTNTRTETVFHNIQVTDERKFLQRLAPQSIFLRPGEMVTVTVTVLVPQETPQGTTDRITFTCHGGETATLSVNLKVITTVDAQDTTSPTVTWTFGSRCDNMAAESANCAERFWTLDITAQDWQTGIMRLQSTPTGLIYRNTYTVGSTEPLKATYIATCCEPKVSLIAYDVAANQRSYNIDVRDIWLTEASIAAIVLGCILLIILIALIIWGIVWCCRRRKVTLDLPTYRSHSTRSME